MGVNFIKKYKKWFFEKVWKSQNKVAVAEEIGCGIDIVLSKIGRANELRQNKK